MKHVSEADRARTNPYANRAEAIAGDRFLRGQRTKDAAATEERFQVSAEGPGKVRNDFGSEPLLIADPFQQLAIERGSCALTSRVKKRQL